jgi:hypothetical protein
LLDFYNQEDELDLNTINFKFAFSVEGYYDTKMKDDPRYVRMYLMLTNFYKDGNIDSISLPYHKCT